MTNRTIRLVLLTVALAASVSVTLDWVSYSVPDGTGFALMSRGDWLGWLSWDGLRPPLALRAFVVLGAWSLVLLSLHRPTLAAGLSLPAALVVATPIILVSPLPFSLHRDVFAGITLSPAVGMWIAMACLLPTAAVTAGAALRRGRR
ncbi:MAG: hypothetical protein JWP11_920 [Frankiales bacterium]|nr:hypothetical protein [Frankiales bacterium]